MRSIRNSETSGLYRSLDQFGFVRLVTDYARFACLTYVFGLEGHRGRALGTRLVERVLEHSNARYVRKWMLATRDAHGLYERLGFTEVDEQEWLMERSSW